MQCRAFLNRSKVTLLVAQSSSDFEAESYVAVPAANSKQQTASAWHFRIR
jgi:hypothetical protein